MMSLNSMFFMMADSISIVVAFVTTACVLSKNIHRPHSYLYIVPLSACGHRFHIIFIVPTLGIEFNLKFAEKAVIHHFAAILSTARKSAFTCSAVLK